MVVLISPAGNKWTVRSFLKPKTSVRLCSPAGILLYAFSHLLQPSVLGRKSEGSITVCSGGALSDRGGVTHGFINIYFNEKLGEFFSEKKLFTNTSIS